RRVVINPGRTFLKERRDDDRAMALRQFLEGGRGGSGDRFGEREIFVVFGLAEILRAKDFLGADDVRALARGAFDGGQSVFQVRGWVGRTGGLDEPHLDGGGSGGTFHAGSTLGVDAN